MCACVVSAAARCPPCDRWLCEGASLMLCDVALGVVVEVCVGMSGWEAGRAVSEIEIWTAICM